MLKNYIFLLLICFGHFTFSQVTYNGNGNTGFGGVIGPSTLQISDDGTTIAFSLTKGSGDFNDALVLYISNGNLGRAVIDGNVNDQFDPLRKAISNEDFSNSTLINFPSGFEATHAIAVNTSFGGLWEIPNTGVIGDEGLNFLASTNSTLTNTTDASFTFSVTWAQLGLTSSDSFDFVGVYLNAGNAFTSDEGYGSGFPNTGNLGGGILTFTGSETYSQTLSNSEIMKSDIRVYMNQKQVYFENLNTPTRVSVFNILGQKIITKTINTSQSLDLSKETPGIYLVRLEVEGKYKTKKIVLN